VSDPVTVSFVRRVRAGREREYEQRLAALQEQAHGFPGYLGTNVVHEPGGREYLSIVRFDGQASLDRWEASGLRQRWQDQLGDIVEGEAVVRQAHGLELWFPSPGRAALPPSRSRMVVVLVAVVAALTFTLAPVVARLLPRAAPAVRTLILVVAQVCLMTYLIMPAVTRLLARWLFVERGSSARADAGRRRGA
jgi:antibiotic biosynthesis monooxygenase (ABM) superfamily enzyme